MPSLPIRASEAVSSSKKKTSHPQTPATKTLFINPHIPSNVLQMPMQAPFAVWRALQTSAGRTQRGNKPVCFSGWTMSPGHWAEGRQNDAKRRFLTAKTDTGKREGTERRGKAAHLAGLREGGGKVPSAVTGPDP